MNPKLVLSDSVTFSGQMEGWISSLRNTSLLYLPKQRKVQIGNC